MPQHDPPPNFSTLLAAQELRAHLEAVATDFDPHLVGTLGKFGSVRSQVPVTGSIDATGRLHREELPLSRYPLELMTTSVMQSQLLAR